MIRIAVLASLAVLAHGWISDCGRSKYGDAGGLGEAGTRIIGGQAARANELPWQVEMGDQRSGQWCGAIIINANWVLTAAHCTEGESVSGLYLTVGQHRLEGNDGTEVEYSVSRYIMHPGYNSFTFDNDIALMEISGSITLNENVAAACKPSAGETYTGRTAVVSGWGTLISGLPVYPEQLMFVQVDVISNEECLQRDYPGEITEGMLCAGDRNSVDACQGDSGGPLVVKNGSQFTVIGVVSWGIGCASGFAGVYARVTTYLDWIDANI